MCACVLWVGWGRVGGALKYLIAGLETATITVANVSNIVALVTKTSLQSQKGTYYCIRYTQTSSPDGRCDWIFFSNFEPWMAKCPMTRVVASAAFLSLILFTTDTEDGCVPALVRRFSAPSDCCDQGSVASQPVEVRSTHHNQSHFFIRPMQCRGTADGDYSTLGTCRNMNKCVYEKKGRSGYE